MTRIPGASAALDGIIAPWAAKIVAVLRAIIETILAVAEATAICCRSWLPVATRPEAKPGFLPPWASALHALACRCSPEFRQTVTMNLRGTREARIKARFAEPSAIEPRRRHMVILAAPELNNHLAASDGHVPT